MSDLRSRRVGAAALAALLAVFAVRLAHTALEKSYTYDEPHYVGTGLYLWRHRNYQWMEVLSAQPPLAFHLASLPWLVADPGPVADTPSAGFELIRQPAAALRRLRLLTRLPFIGLACWGAVLLFCWGREAAGTWVGLLATFLYTFCPTVLANAALAHSDITVTVLYLQTLYAYWRWSRRPTAARIVLCGLSLGLALLAKLSAILLVPTLGILVVLRAVGIPGASTAGTGTLGRRLAAAAGVLTVLGITASTVLWIGYGGSFASAPATGEIYAHLPLPGYLRALLFDVKANAGGRRTYLMGEFSAHGWWYFFPVAFAVKTPLAMLALLALAMLPRRGARRAAPDDRTPAGAPASAAPGVGPVLGAGMGVYGLVACFVLKVPLGVRYILPFYPLLHLAVALRLAPQGGWRRWAALAACAWLTAASLRAHPDYLAYFNAAVGGPEQGHRYLLESNLDWGQDLSTLARYLATRGNPPLHLAYFGRETPDSYGMRARPLRDCKPVTGVVAVSMNFLHGLYSPRVFAQPDPDCWKWLAGREPVAQPGHSIAVYEVPPAPAP